MDREELARRLVATFVTELEEQVQILNRDLLALEKTTGTAERAELVRSVFRVAHSLKGAARAVDLPALERFCHALEDMLSPVRDDPARLRPETTSLVFAAADALAAAAERLRAGREVDAEALEAMARRFERNDDRAEGAPPASVAPAPAAPPAPAPAREAEPSAAGPRAAGVVRVSAEKLDALLAASGELVVARHRIASRPAEVRALQDVVRRLREDCRRAGRGGRRRRAPDPGFEGADVERLGEHLQRLERELDRVATDLRADGRRIEQLSSLLDEEVHRARTLPFAEACAGFERMARDLARASGKDVAIVVDGGDVELDRAIIERLRDPLRHLVRNAVDHGIEPAEERAARGKAAQGRVTVRAELRGGQVQVLVADDGRGLDLDALREQARRRSLPEPADPRELARLIFLPGLSTARTITDVSGRGVGLDVVKSQVEALHGSVEVLHDPQRGTRFALTVPLTLTVLRALLFRAAGRTFAVPTVSVAQLVRTAPGAIRTVEGRDVLLLGRAPVPVASLAAVLGIESAPPRADDRVSVLLVAAGEQRVGFVVDEFVAEQDVLVKNLGRRIGRVRHVSGATLLPHGGIALVLSAAHLVRTALAASGRTLEAAVARAEIERRRRLLVVDDSITTRSLEKSILEAAGYEVAVAADGAAAWDLLQRQAVDLVVSDVDMPKMDGFELTRALRASERFRDLPIVLLTARSTEEDRARGAAAGANAFLVKSAFDQRSLLETIGQLL